MSRTIVITGASDGIAAAAARQLAGRGDELVLVGRSPQKTAAIGKELGVAFHVADFSKLDEVRGLARELGSLERIDVLANNAGGIMGERRLTADGNELTFQVNHLAPFLLTTLLLDQLAASGAKVIQTASAAANLFGSAFDVEDLQNEHGYSPQTAYGYGKLENVLFTRELQRRYGERGINAVAFHPGVVRSAFASDTTHPMRFVYHSPLKYLATISPECSAKRLVKLIDGEPGRDWQPGGFYNGSKPFKLKFQDPDGSAARRLWDASEELVATPAAS